MISQKAIDAALTEIGPLLVGKSLCQVTDEALNYIAYKVAKHLHDLEQE